MDYTEFPKTEERDIKKELEEAKKTIATLETRIAVLESQVAWYRKPAQKEIDEHRNIATHRKEWLEANIGMMKHVDGFEKTKEEDQTSVGRGHHGGVIMAINEIGQYYSYPVDSQGNKVKSWNT